MKKVVLLATLAAACTFTACKKDSEKTQTKTEMITAKSWRVTADKSSISGNGQSSTSDDYATYQACEKDNFLKFMTDKKVEFNEGPTKCAQSDPQTEIGAWDFNSDQTKLTLTDQGSGLSLVFDVIELSSSTLKIKYSTTSQGYTYTTEQTYASF
ncbi:hypothetical protein [Hymenobacter koreensis]|uniref:Lipocalin-like domain-containing protein n=1 Tax=Hymenobacter koreensis TaxID=1084523 RepID=A0ABP8IXH1_9BACT